MNVNTFTEHMQKLIHEYFPIQVECHAFISIKNNLIQRYVNLCMQQETWSGQQSEISNLLNLCTNINKYLCM